MLYVRTARGTVDEVCRKVEAAAAANKFGVLGTIDLTKKMREKGVPFAAECRVLEVCNPGQAQKVLSARIAAATLLPCRIAVYEEAGAVKVGTLLPTALVAALGAPELAGVAREVEETLRRIIDAAAG